MTPAQTEKLETQIDQAIHYAHELLPTRSLRDWEHSTGVNRGSLSRYLNGTRMPHNVAFAIIRG